FVRSCLTPAHACTLKQNPFLYGRTVFSSLSIKGFIKFTRIHATKKFVNLLYTENLETEGCSDIN
ncbi:hypothetical protein scyTo_0022709, partial [Scyliorhinus torazame]|nr:hypothetical protein [Scyliorhinus torazame]